MAAEPERSATPADDEQAVGGAVTASAAASTGPVIDEPVVEIAGPRPAADKAADLDQRLAERDRTASDADQTASESDQTAADRDQARADADQRSSNRDQAAADLDQAMRPSLTESDDAYDVSRAARRAGTIERAETAFARAATAADRLEHTLSREATARLRDLNADARDRAADARDAASARSDRAWDLFRMRSFGGARARAAADRARAAADRAQAAADRVSARLDRTEAMDELRRAQCDSLTGALGREIGLVAIGHEIDRARHANGRLVLAWVDVDRLKETNDQGGHAAGDRLLRDVVGAIQAHLRSYDPTVRLGGDEFVCVLADTTVGDARRRFEEIGVAIERVHPGGSISVGFATLRPSDTLKDLMERADKSLYTVKHTRISLGT